MVVFRQILSDNFVKVGIYEREERLSLIFVEKYFMVTNRDEEKEGSVNAFIENYKNKKMIFN